MTGKEKAAGTKGLKRLIYKKYTTALRMDIRYVRIVVYLFQNYVNIEIMTLNYVPNHALNGVRKLKPEFLQNLVGADF